MTITKSGRHTLAKLIIDALRMMEEEEDLEGLLALARRATIVNQLWCIHNEMREREEREPFRALHRAWLRTVKGTEWDPTGGSPAS